MQWGSAEKGNRAANILDSFFALRYNNTVVLFEPFSRIEGSSEQAKSVLTTVSTQEQNIR